MSYPLIPSHWGFRFQHTNLEEHKHSVITHLCPLYLTHCLSIISLFLHHQDLWHLHSIDISPMLYLQVDLKIATNQHHLQYYNYINIFHGRLGGPSGKFSCKWGFALCGIVLQFSSTYGICG